jgi:hypothetical protein
MEEIIKALNYQPVCLSEDELENPLNTMTYFFVNYPIHQAREHIWHLYNSWINHSSEYVDAEQVKDMAFFYTQVIEFLNTSFVYTEKKKLGT